jgi:DNA-binding transcriptional LysR family regulator
MYTFNLIHLKFFCDAVALKSVSEAAKKNFVTQSAISQGIAKLETIIGVPLATHTRSSFQPTEEGLVVFEQAGDIFKALQGIQEKLKEKKQEISGEVQFMCTHSLGMSYIASAFKKMQEMYPKVKLKFRLGNPQTIRTALQQRSEEFALVVFDPGFSQYQKETIYSGHFHLFQNKSAADSLLDHGLLIDYKESLFVHDLRRDYREAYQRELSLQAELAGWEVVARFAEKGIGVGFLPDYILHDQRYPSLEALPLQLPPYRYEICAIYKKGEKLSRAACAFMDLLKGKGS